VTERSQRGLERLQSGGREAEERLQREKERLQRGLERMQSGDYRVATERSQKDCREDEKRHTLPTLACITPCNAHIHNAP
jgi:Tfp pilus assembly protein PilF